MWNPFRSRPLLTEEDQLFQFETFKWLLRHFGGDPFHKETALVLPTDEFFPLAAASPHEAAEATFHYVKRYAGMEDWPCELVPQQADPERLVAPTLIVKGGPSSPLGTFSVPAGDRAVITYNPAIVANPVQMVATFAHELAHYLTAAAPEPPPGGWENAEFATDVAAVFMGFGIFLAEAAFTFTQYAGVDYQGWQSQRSGYLTQAEYAYSLAMFLKLKDIPGEAAYPHLGANARGYLKKALSELKDSAPFAEVAQTGYAGALPGE